MAKEPDYSRDIDQDAADSAGDALHQQLDNDQIYEGNDRVKSYTDGLRARDVDQQQIGEEESPEHQIQRNNKAPKSPASGTDAPSASTPENTTVGGGAHGVTQRGLPPEAAQQVPSALEHVGGRASDRVPRAGNQANGAQIYGHDADGAGSSHMLPPQNNGINRNRRKSVDREQQRKVNQERTQTRLRTRRNRERELEELDKQDAQNRSEGRQPERQSTREQVRAEQEAAEQQRQEAQRQLEQSEPPVSLDENEQMPPEQDQREGRHSTREKSRMTQRERDVKDVSAAKEAIKQSNRERNADARERQQRIRAEKAAQAELAQKRAEQAKHAKEYERQRQQAQQASQAGSPQDNAGNPQGIQPLAKSSNERDHVIDDYAIKAVDGRSRSDNAYIRSGALRKAAKFDEAQAAKLSGLRKQTATILSCVSGRAFDGNRQETAAYMKENQAGLAKALKMDQKDIAKSPQAVEEALKARMVELSALIKDHNQNASDERELAGQYEKASTSKSEQVQSKLIQAADTGYQQLLKRLKQRRQRYFNESDRVSAKMNKQPWAYAKGDARTPDVIAKQIASQKSIEGLDRNLRSNSTQYEWLAQHVGHDAANELPKNMPIQKTNAAVQQADGQHNARMLPATISKGAKFSAQGEQEVQHTKQTQPTEADLDKAAENAQKVSEAFNNPVLTKYLEENMKMMQSMQKEIEALHQEIKENAESHHSNPFKNIRKKFAQNHEKMQHVPTSSMVAELAYRGTSRAIAFSKAAFTYGAAALGGALHIGGRVNHHAKKKARQAMHTVNEGTISTIDSGMDPAAAQKLQAQHQKNVAKTEKKAAEHERKEAQALGL